MKKTYKIDVDCANCAAKMEREAAKIDGVSKVSISFLTGRIMLEADDDRFENILAEVEKVCRKVERKAKIHRQ